MSHENEEPLVSQEPVGVTQGSVGVPQGDPKVPDGEPEPAPKTEPQKTTIDMDDR